MPLELIDFPTEVLLMIFGFLQREDLMNLMVVCKRFYQIIEYYWDCIIFNRRKKFLATNQISEYMENRSIRLLTPFRKNRISNNWKKGRYKATNLFISNHFTPQFHLEKKSIWFAKGDSIRCCRRYLKRINLDSIQHEFRGINCKDVCKFVVKNDTVSVVNGDVVKLFSIGQDECTSNITFNDCYLTCIDMESNLIAVGSKEGILQLLTISEDFNLSSFEQLRFDDRIWCLSLNSSKLALGFAAINMDTPIIVRDNESGQNLHEFQRATRGAGILQLKWDGPNQLWSGGYDCYLRRWDLRAGDCVQQFMDPWYSKVNCFDCDFVNTAITGGDANRATLWDTRQAKYVQHFFMRRSNIAWIRSPIHCLAFDAEHLFAATDSYINMLNFTVIKGRIQDYSDLYIRQLVI